MLSVEKYSSYSPQNAASRHKDCSQQKSKLFEVACNSLLKKSRHAPQQAVCASSKAASREAGSMTLPVMPTPLEAQRAVAHRVAAQDASRGVSFGRQGHEPSLSKAALRKKRLGPQRRAPGPFSADLYVEGHGEALPRMGPKTCRRKGFARMRY